MVADAATIISFICFVLQTIVTNLPCSDGFLLKIKLRTLQSAVYFLCQRSPILAVIFEWQGVQSASRFESTCVPPRESGSR